MAANYPGKLTGKSPDKRLEISAFSPGYLLSLFSQACSLSRSPLLRRISS